MFTTACLPNAPRSMKVVWCAISNTLTGLKTIVQPMQLPLSTSSECCKRHNASWVVDPSSYMTGLPIHPYICHLYRLALPPCELQVCWSDLSSQLPHPPSSLIPSSPLPLSPSSLPPLFPPPPSSLPSLSPSSLHQHQCGSCRNILCAQFCTGAAEGGGYRGHLLHHPLTPTTAAGHRQHYGEALIW